VRGGGDAIARHLGIGGIDYCFDAFAIAEPATSAAQTTHVTSNPYYRNKRNVWIVPIESFHGAHFATFPPKLIIPCILAGCPEGSERSRADHCDDLDRP
jgi:hypothetical protein